MTYFSVDVETTGLVPGVFDLLSIGAVELDTGREYHAILRDIADEGLRWDEDTKKWWTKDQQEAYIRIHELFQYQESYSDYHGRLQGFSEWIEEFPKPYYFVAWPASFDYPFVAIEFHKADIYNPFNYRTVDIKSWLAGAFDVSIGADRNELPEWVWEEPDNPHDALEDARAQANVFRKLLNRHEDV